MKNLKKEHKLIITMVSVLLLGWIFNSFLVSSKQKEVSAVSAVYDTQMTIFQRNQEVHKNLKNAKKIYDDNRKSSESFVVANTMLIERLQNILQSAAIKYSPNDFTSLNSEDLIEGNLALYLFDLSFTTNYSSLMLFLKNMERDNLLFDIVDLNINKVVNSGGVIGADGQVKAVDTKEQIKVTMRIQISKFI